MSPTVEVTPQGDVTVIVQVGASTSSGATTGTLVSGFWTSAPVGYVLANGGTIGSASSGADRANVDTADLFALLWNNVVDAYCPVSGGRGSNAASDFAANKRLAVPDMRRRSPFGYEGGEIVAGVDPVLGATLGEESHTLTEAELPVVSSHTHPTSATHQHGLRVFSDSISPSAGSTALQGISDLVSPFTTDSIQGATPGDTDSAGGFGSGSAHNTIHPVLCMNFAIKL